MVHKIPENNVEIRSKDGGDGIELLLDGYDLALHIEHWEVAPDGIAGDPILTVRIRCKHVVMDVEEQPLGMYRAPTMQELHESEET